MCSAIAHSEELCAPPLMNVNMVDEREICGVLEASTSALNAVQHALEHEMVQSARSVQEWQQQIRKVRGNLEDFVQHFNQQLEEVQRISFEQQHLTLQEYNQLLCNTLSDSMEKILFVSKRSIMMVYMLDDAMDALASLSGFIKDIKNMHRQANMLAVNAAIEAVHAGQAGQNFAVVAREVKQLGEDIKTLADIMHHKLHDLSGTVQTGYQTLEEIATVDLNGTIESKDKMDAMLTALLTQQENTRKLLGDRTNDHVSALHTLEKLLLNMQKNATSSAAMSETIACVSERQRTLQNSLEHSLPDAGTIPDAQLVEMLTTRLSSPALLELLQDALDKKDLRISLATQNIRMIEHTVKE